MHQCKKCNLFKGQGQGQGGFPTCVGSPVLCSPQSFSPGVMVYGRKAMQMRESVKEMKFIYFLLFKRVTKGETITKKVCYSLSLSFWQGLLQTKSLEINFMQVFIFCTFCEEVQLCLYCAAVAVCPHSLLCTKPCFLIAAH